MSALEVIEQIKALPAEEQATVVAFVHQLEAAPAARELRFATAEQAKAAGDGAVQQYEEVFRKLAQ